MSKVDWTKPLEAVHEDGRVVALEADKYYGFPDGDGDYCTKGSNMEGLPIAWKADGQPWCKMPEIAGWRIRNVQPTATPSPELINRMKDLIGRIGTGSIADVLQWGEEARAIARELEPVDADLLAARDVVAQEHTDSGHTNTDRSELDSGKLDSERPMRIALAAIAKGRQMQKDGL